MNIVTNLLIATFVLASTNLRRAQEKKDSSKAGLSMKIFALLLLLSFSFPNSYGQDLEQKHRRVVLNFIKIIKSQDKQILAEHSTFPITRTYPVPAIKTKHDLIRGYDQLFDAELIRLVATSNPDKDWKTVGYRGIMLMNGKIWLDYDGNLISINHESIMESKYRQRLIEVDRALLHPSIQTFSRPMAILETKKHRIRIDDLGSGNYRYASWPLNTTTKEKPAIIIDRGQLIPEGSGGNHKYVFTNQGFKYECVFINSVSSSSLPDEALLLVASRNKRLIYTEAKIL